MPPITEPQTFSVLGKQQRNEGTYTTASATIPEGVGVVRVQDSMADAVASDPANSFILTVYVSPDGVGWAGVFREQWTGGTHIDKHTGLAVPNHMDVGFGILQDWWGHRVRAELDLPVRMQIGFQVTVMPVVVTEE